MTAMVLVVGCKAPVKSTVNTFQTAIVSNKSGKSVSGLSELELQQKLAGFYVTFVNRVESATEQAAMQTGDLALRRKLIEGRIRAVRACRQVVFEHPPMAAFVDTWNLCLQMHQYLNSPAAGEYFGDAQPLIATAADKLESDIEDLGRLFLDTNQLAQAKAKLEVFARTHPFSASQELPLTSQQASGDTLELGWLLEIPLSPFRAFQGVDQTAAAVHEFNFVAAGFAQTARDLPQELSWQLELRLIQLQQELQTTLDEIDHKQTNTQATLQQLRQAINEANQSLSSVQKLSDHITELIILVIVVLFTTMLVYRILLKKWVKRDAPHPKA